MQLLIQPVHSIRNLTTEEAVITNTLYRILREVSFGKPALRQRINYVKKNLGGQKIAAGTGNFIDNLFKTRVLSAKARGELPAILHVTERFERGPDVWLDDIAWDVTTAEQGRAHIDRDVIYDPTGWNVYFILDY